ncbi:hypothetical protein [Mucilaginibacter arboris]|uniref:DUF4738 domain-containing protein n=1 Tax=Mucilaginibacter arboris TaxID=2682090 RepID=A0A7K1SU88_9SPHI|nr:hypothetical protein [Mucilaginibacter arboris]MVN20899.1 hypothetical protein [Mucilaginibacter arboris]
MYWYKSAFYRFRFAVLAFLFGLASCKPDIQQSKTSYFNLSPYFSLQAKKYAHANLSVLKTVSRNGEAETKKVKIENWAGELSVFAESDINKPSWRNSYKTTVSGNTIIYTALEPDLKTREIILKRENDKVVYLMIFNVVTNKLFQTREKLTYYPDSLYIIQRKQQVRFLGTNNYLIKGKLK